MDYSIRHFKKFHGRNVFLTLLLFCWRSLSYWNQSIDLHNKSMDWFLYNMDSVMIELMHNIPK